MISCSATCESIVQPGLGAERIATCRPVQEARWPGPVDNTGSLEEFHGIACNSGRSHRRYVLDGNLSRDGRCPTSLELGRSSESTVVLTLCA